MPSDMPFRQIFGSWGNALREAGFTPIKILPGGRKKGSKNKKGVRNVKSHGYIHIFKPLHCEAMKNGYVREHRMIISDYLGRKLKKNEQVHHKNENKSDNRIENLELMTIGEHSTLHHKGKPNHRRNRFPCIICSELTGSKYKLCTKHYKLQWQRLKYGIIGNIYQNPDLLNNK